MLGKVAKGGGYDGKLDWSEMKGKLGYKPHSGTLNVMLEQPFTVTGGIELINSFIAYPGYINGTPCHVCCKAEDVTVNQNVDRRKVWIVAPVRLRDKLNLSDGQEVDVQF